MRSKSDTSLAIVIPMHNEEAGAERCILAVMSVIPTLPIAARLILVDDGSRDNTSKILDQALKQWGNKMAVVTHSTNLGYGAGLATGITKAEELGLTHAVFMDSDLTNNPKDLHKFARKTRYDLVKASRYVKGGKMKGVPWQRQIISITGNWLCRVCFRMKLHDYTNGFRMIRVKLMAGYTYREKGFAIILEEMYVLKQKKAKCSEVPVTLTARTKTASHFHYTPAQIWAYLKYALKAAII